MSRNVRWDLKEVDHIDKDEVREFEACLADACLEGEADQIAEVLRIRSSFRSGQRDLRGQVEAEFRKFAERPWDLESAIGEYEGMRPADMDVPISPLGDALPPSPRSAADDTSSFIFPPPPAGLPKEQRPPRPTCGANTAPPSPAGGIQLGVPHIRRFLPARAYSSRSSSCQGSDVGSFISEPSTAASSTGSSPHVSHPSKSQSRYGSGGCEQHSFEAEAPWTDWKATSASQADRRRSLSQRLQQKLQERHSEWPELSSEGDVLYVGRSRAGVSSYGGASHPHEASRDIPDDWYSPPDEYTWCDATGTAYTFATAGENERPSSGSFRRHPQDYSFQFRRGEQRTNPMPPQDSAGRAPNPGQAQSSHRGAPPGSGTRAPPPVSATPPRQPKPPTNRTVYGFGSSRRDNVPPMHSPGAKHTSGAGWRSSFWSSSGSPSWNSGHPGASAHSSAWSSPKAGSAPHQSQPPPQKPPPPSSRPSAPGAAAAASMPKTHLESKAVQGLEVRLQELKRVPKEEQRRASKELLVQWHPDKNPERGEEATRVFQWLQNRRKELLGF